MFNLFCKQYNLEENYASSELIFHDKRKRLQFFILINNCEIAEISCNV